MNLTELFRYIVSLSLLGSVIVVGLFLIKLLFKQKLSASWHYTIWFVLIFRLLIPFTPSSPFSVLSLIPQYPTTLYVSQPLVNSVTPSSDTVSQNTLPASLGSSESTPISTMPAPARRIGLNWATAASIWLIGVLAILSYLFIVNSYLFFKSTKLSICEDKAVAEILEGCCSTLQVRTQVSVIYDDSLKSPALFGLFRPKIIISPRLIALLPPEELRYIFLHELSHLKRRDLYINFLVTIVQVIYWFNPLIGFALHQMKQDCEMACDATALAAIKEEDHKKYGQTIISLLQLLSQSHWAPGTLGFANKFNSRRIIMISTFKKTSIKWAIAVLTLTLVVGCSSLSNPINPTDSQNQKDPSTSSQQNTNTNTSSSSTDSNSIVYSNTQYGFSFSLPVSWKGYSIISSPWEGLTVGSQNTGETVVETGPTISIRDPRWTSQTPRQDIPIMVFTLDQWNSLQQGIFHIGAAPVGPSELGRNNSYVFALPARYNFAFPAGYEEVATILKNNPLQTIQTNQQHPDSTESMVFNITVLGQQGKVINSDFAAKTSTLGDVEKLWGKADSTEYVATAKGRYATYTSHNVVFGLNKGDQIFEVRSYDSRLKGISLNQVKGVLGTPAYDAKSNGQEIIGYKAGSEFKIEMVFPQPTSSNPNPVMDHYNVLYPRGTVNSMADDPGRQW